MQKVAVVTGSSSGLGLAITEFLLSAGYVVFGGSRSGTGIEHDGFYDVELDITSEDSVRDFFQTIHEYADGIELVVNNAGICEMSPVTETSIEDFRRHLDTNTTGAFLLFKYLEPFLLQNQTHIISVLSAAAKHAYPNVSAYNASKFGLLGLLLSIEKEWKNFGVRFTKLFPGAINTPLWDKLGSKFSREKMLSIQDFMQVFRMVAESSNHVQFHDITFLHSEGFLE